MDKRHRLQRAIDALPEIEQARVKATAETLREVLRQNANWTLALYAFTLVSNELAENGGKLPSRIILPGGQPS